ncbi:MAG: hypothetical protein K2V38_15650, partial [Gemmataceae bacterium]|nr:hypothetical protein [Gemmataceae bacterium]
MLTRYLLPAVSLVAFSFAILQMTKAQQVPLPVKPPIDPGKSPFGRQVSGAGIVEPETENIAVGTHVPGVVKAVHVRPGDRLKAGAPLFDLDDRQMTAELVARQATRDSAATQLAKLKALPRPEEKPPLEAKIAEAKANLDDKIVLYERARRETERGVGSAEVSETRKMAVDVARAQLARAEADFRLTDAGAWKPDLAVSAAALAQSEAQVRQALTELDRLKVAAPRVRQPGADRAPEPIPESDLVEFRVLQVNVR